MSRYIKLWRSLENASTLLITLGNKISNMSTTMVDEDKKKNLFKKGFSYNTPSLILVVNAYVNMFYLG